MNHTLTLHLYSFGFKRSGIPQDTIGHGGGHVFDCRCLPNPGRQEIYKNLSGLDQEVVDFLEKESSVKQFADTCQQLIQQSIENYQARGFEHLMVSFGCTGGQHRSVYQAELAKSVFEQQEGLKVTLTHQERSYWDSL